MLYVKVSSPEVSDSYNEWVFLFYSRTLAKSLIAKNEMLHHRIEALESRRPPMSKSPMLNALMHKYHEEN